MENYNRSISFERFKKARWVANMRSLMNFFGNKEERLLAFDDILKLTKSTDFKNLGLQTIKVNDIIGSEGRHDDFNKNFLPLKDSLKDRWANIDMMNELQRNLPPITVFKTDQYYFVRDGNHRVSVAKARKQVYIDAYVTELVLDVHITKEMNPRDRYLIQMNTHFNELTGIKKWGKGVSIVLTEPENYQAMLTIVEKYRQCYREKSGKDSTLSASAEQWYFDIFLPFAEDAYLNDLLAKLPNRTTGDLYVWIQMNLEKIETAEPLPLDRSIRFDQDAKRPAENIGLLQEVLIKRSLHSENYLYNDYLSIVVINLLFDIDSTGRLRIYLVKRKYHPYEDHWSLPIAMLRKDETRNDAAERCIHNVIGLEREYKMNHFCTLDRTDRHPFGRIMAFCCLGFVEQKESILRPGEIAKEISLCNLGDLPKLVYDHNLVIRLGAEHLLKATRDYKRVTEIFPKTFTLEKIEKCLGQLESFLSETKTS